MRGPITSHRPPHLPPATHNRKTTASPSCPSDYCRKEPWFYGCASPLVLQHAGRPDPYCSEGGLKEMHSVSTESSLQGGPGWMRCRWGLVKRCRIRGEKAASQRHSTAQQLLSPKKRCLASTFVIPWEKWNAFSPKGALTAILNLVSPATSYTVTSWAPPGEA